MKQPGKEKHDRKAPQGRQPEKKSENQKKPDRKDPQKKQPEKKEQPKKEAQRKQAHGEDHNRKEPQRRPPERNEPQKKQPEKKESPKQRKEHEVRERREPANVRLPDSDDGGEHPDHDAENGIGTKELIALGVMIVAVAILCNFARQRRFRRRLFSIQDCLARPFPRWFKKKTHSDVL
jgi:hypothetical protein